MDKSHTSGRFTLSAVAAAVVCFHAPAQALGLGRLAVASSLGEALRAEIDVTSLSAEEASTLKIRVATPDAYKAAGVEYNAVLANTHAQIGRRPDGRPYVQITSDRAVQEPFLDVILEMTWSGGRLVRQYTLLVDPPSMRVPSPPAVATAPSLAPAPRSLPAPVLAPAPRPSPAPTLSIDEIERRIAAAERRAAAAERRAAIAERRAAAAAATVGAEAAPAVAASPRAPAAVAPREVGDTYTVRPGDTLYRIAARTQRGGASVDQMLVALYRDNPDAFIADNVNRLKAGATLKVPGAQDVKTIDTAQARRLLQARAADFPAYRQRLAAAAPAIGADQGSREATGRVQAPGEERKPGAPSGDRLVMTPPGAAVPGAAPPAAPPTGARREQLAKNVEELEKLQKDAATARAAGEASAGRSTAPSAAPGAGTAGTLPAPAPGAAPPAPSTTAPPAPAPTPPPVATAPAPPVTAPVPAPAPTVTPTPAPAGDTAPAAARPPAPAPAPQRVEEPGFFATLLDNPLVLPAAGILVALLAGLGFYRVRRRAGTKDSADTSFLESRVQPDSFFGASGGQRVDTRDASTPSSMSYSLSQLDAIGDVDPVAEADVYLAYGRDLQAEEILKEAMRANPERLAIRTKLLEVYAKRRDTKGFELLATQLYTLTRGTGEDWAKAQELGVSIDPENPLYKPGGQPAALASLGGVVEPLGASTMPQSVMATPSNFDPGSGLDAPSSEPPRTGRVATVDLDLDLDAEPSQANSFSGPDSTQRRGQAPASSNLMDFELSAMPMEFDRQAQPMPGGQTAASVDAANDPLARKLELAEEFRQIGDVDGARDLLQEVLAKASDGALKSKARTMLDSLA